MASRSSVPLGPQTGIFGWVPAGWYFRTHVVAGHVDAVVGVQVAQQDGVDRERVDVPLQGAERAVAEVERPGSTCARPDLGLEQVAARG